MNMPEDMLCMRHGISEINEAVDRVKLGDRSCFTPEFMARPDALFRLTRKGIEETEIARGWFLDEFIPERGPIHIGFTSGFNRSMETAAYLDLPGVRWKPSIYLHERSWGDLIGKPDCEKDYAAVFAQRDKDPLYPRIPGGDSLANECRRVDAFNSELAREHAGKRVVIVTHGDFLWCFRITIEDLPPWVFREMYLAREWRIKNLQIIHYSRRDPEGNLGDHLEWMRIVDPVRREVLMPWTRFRGQTYSSAELRDVVDKTLRLVD